MNGVEVTSEEPHQTDVVDIEIESLTEENQSLETETHHDEVPHSPALEARPQISVRQGAQQIGCYIVAGVERNLGGVFLVEVVGDEGGEEGEEPEVVQSGYKEGVCENDQLGQDFHYNSIALEI